MQGLVELEAKFDAISASRGDVPVPANELVRRFTTIIVDGIAR
jgi:hypothetical protein